MKLDVILAKVFKFVTFVLFTFMTLVYFGFLLVLPLDVMFQIIHLFQGFGFHVVLAGAIGVGALGYICYRISLLPTLYNLVLDIGFQLVAFGQTQIKRFDALIEAA